MAYFAGQQIDPDMIFGKVARQFLPQILPGMIGLFLASVLASVMSSCDAFMISSSGLFTENAYKKLIPHKSQNHYLTVARLVSFLVVIGGVGFAYWLPGVIKGLEIFWKVPSMMGIAFWLGLFWRSMTGAGAWASTIAGFGAWFLTTRSFFISFLSNLPVADSWRFVIERSWGMEMYLPWQMVFYLVIGSVVGIVVSLFTNKVEQEKLENYYALLRTPVKLGEKVLEPCTLPEGAIVPPRNVLFPNTNLEISKPSKNATIGFLVGWVLVAGIILVVVLISRG